jgi:predicted lysophospholipase L1 biosynthesis ABC-type transport system permease subunit
MALIILVAALNIISALVMVVMEKSRDIAILKSMGATSRSIMKIFFIQGLVIAITGTSLGVIGGLSLCELLSRYKFIELPSNVYPMTTLPIKVLPMDVTIVAVSSIVITLLATLYPSWKGSTVQPAEVLSNGTVSGTGHNQGLPDGNYGNHRSERSLHHHKKRGDDRNNRCIRFRKNNPAPDSRHPGQTDRWPALF